MTLGEALSLAGRMSLAPTSCQQLVTVDIPLDWVDFFLV